MRCKSVKQRTKDQKDAAYLGPLWRPVCAWRWLLKTVSLFISVYFSDKDRVYLTLKSSSMLVIVAACVVQYANGKRTPRSYLPKVTARFKPTEPNQ
jgi:hypothetical protein